MNQRRRRTKKSGNGKKVGLAVGIPVALLSVALLAPSNTSDVTEQPETYDSSSASVYEMLGIDKSLEATDNFTIESESEAETIAPETTPEPETTEPEVIVPETTAATTPPPETTAATTPLVTTAPETTAPETTTAPPVTTAPETTAPETTTAPPIVTEPETTAPSSAIQLISLTTPCANKSNATITIKGKPNTTYDIDVHYDTTISTAKGLEDKVSDAEGFVSWTWRVGPKTNPGIHPITITGGDDTFETAFETYET